MSYVQQSVSVRGAFRHSLQTLTFGKSCITISQTNSHWYLHQMDWTNEMTMQGVNNGSWVCSQFGRVVNHGGCQKKRGLPAFFLCLHVFCEVNCYSCTYYSCNVPQFLSSIYHFAGRSH